MNLQKNAIIVLSLLVVVLLALIGWLAVGGRHASGTSLVAMPPPAATSDPPKYDALIGQGNQLLAQDQTKEAYAAALEAAALDEKRFDAYALAALVLQRQGAKDQAAKFLAKAMERAPEEKKPTLEKLADLIRDTSRTPALTPGSPVVAGGLGTDVHAQFTLHLEAGKQAAAANLMGKAAREYEEAWKLKPAEAEVGMQAAIAYAAVEDYRPSVRIAKKVALMATGETVRKAKEHLESLKPIVASTVEIKTQEAESFLADKKGKDAEVVIRELIELDPQPGYGQFLLARSLAQQKQLPAALEAAQQAIALGFSDKDKWFDAPEISTLAADPHFVMLMADALGKPVEQRLTLAAEVANWSAKHHPVTNSIGMTMMPIPPGRFVMGSPATEEGRNDFESQHHVTLSKGFMATTQVTQAQWQAVMGNNPSYFKGDKRPVEMVSWEDAVDFYRKLSAKEGKQYRLPTEAEWEYACRAGTTGSFGGTGRLNDMGWYDGNSGMKTHQVGQKQANAWGLYDMHGNVFQWCNDWGGDYPQGDVSDPTGAGSGASRVLRGGAWYSDPSYCRSALRTYLAPDSRYDYVGFRVVLDLSE